MSRNDLAESVRRPGGRPLDRTKDQAILDGARLCFFERGFAAATMEEVAARAGVSKVTVYKRFEDKEGLFEAVVRREMTVMEEAFEAWPYSDGSLAERLNAFGSILLRFLYSAEHRLLDRMLAHDLKHSPEMARRFFNAGPGACRARLAAMLAEAAARGEIAIDDPLLAAADVSALWSGFIPKEVEFAITPPVDGALIDERVRRGTRLFLKAVHPAS
jgi:TetR/AcrR family transcriptional repressor of mexJK operon